MSKSFGSHSGVSDGDKLEDPAEYYARTEGLADEQSILSALHNDLKSFGYAGSTKPTELAYLAFFSRGLPKPCHLLFKGPSGCGKSFALERALSYIPKTAYLYRSGMSDMALAYSGWNLKHKYLVLGEAAGLTEGRGRAFLRQLMSDGKITYSTVQHGKDGHEGADLPSVQGPVGVMMTTTDDRLHPEDETRFLSFYMDQSRERIKETLLSQAKTELSLPSDEHLARWHAHHNFCFAGHRKVVIPYLEDLADRLPVGDHRVFRDFQQVQSLIKAHAVMHQATRKCDGNEVIATLEDYKAVYNLVDEPLSQCLREAVPPHIRDVVEAVSDWFAENGKRRGLGVNQSTIAQRMGRNPSVVSRNVHTAIELGYVRSLGAMGRGREALLEPGDVELPSGKVLPSPEELEIATVKRAVAKRPSLQEWYASQPA